MSRIPADRTAEFTSWFMPEVKEGQIVHAEKLQQRGPRGELVNVDKDEVIYSSITAGQLEEISNQAYEELREQAYQDGLKEGHAAGMEAASQQLQQQAELLQSTIQQFHQYLGGQDDEVEQAMINIVTCVANAVIRREISIDSSHIHQVIKDAIAVLPKDAGNITIFLSEQDYQLLKSHADLPENWQIQCDVSLSAGGCRVKTKYSSVDFTLEEQFQETINSLVEKRFAELAQQSKQRAEELLDSPEQGLNGDE